MCRMISGNLYPDLPVTFVGIRPTSLWIMLPPGFLCKHYIDTIHLSVYCWWSDGP